MTALEMHGTGTALGDPIEMGAALAVLKGMSMPTLCSARQCTTRKLAPFSRSRHKSADFISAMGLSQLHGLFVPEQESNSKLTGLCLAGAHHAARFSAAKSHMGHAEPAAGLVGMCNAATMLQRHQSHAIMHLRQVSF